MAGAAALNTVNTLSSMLQALQWHLQNVPEGARALNRVQEQLDHMIAFATSQENQPTEGQEGLAQILQEVTRIRRVLESQEEFGEVLDSIQTHLGSQATSVGTLQKGMNQLVAMIVQIGTTLAALVSHANQNQEMP
eukprot:6027729-Pyramimonas_sp.AAC.1